MKSKFVNDVMLEMLTKFACNFYFVNFYPAEFTINSPFLHYPLVPSFRKINIGKTGNQNPPDLKGQGGSGYLFFQY